MTADIDEPGPRDAEYPFSKWDLEVAKAFAKLRGRPRHCGFNALRGLKRAWAIAPLDPEMALFRAITAEEEAATALMFALQRRRYPGAAKLDPRNHVHKAGWSPFLRTVETVMAECGFPSPNFRIDAASTPPRLDVFVPSEELGLEPGHLASPDEPLNGLLRAGSINQGAARVMDFQAELQRQANAGGKQDIRALIRAEANLRNLLLYASDNGFTVVERPDEFLIRRRRPVMLLLTLTVAILQTPKHQLLAVQVVEGYLRAIGKIPSDLFDYDAAVEVGSDFTIEVVKVAGGQVQGRIVRSGG